MEKNLNAIFFKRINKEKQLIHKQKGLMCVPINEKQTVWHFTFKGAEDSVFEGGIYHGEI